MRTAEVIRQSPVNADKLTDELKEKAAKLGYTFFENLNGHMAPTPIRNRKSENYYEFTQMVYLPETRYGEYVGFRLGTQSTSGYSKEQLDKVTDSMDRALKLIDLLKEAGFVGKTFETK